MSSTADRRGALWASRARGRRGAANRLRSDVVALATDAGRIVGSEGHAQAVATLEGWLQARGLRPYRGRQPSPAGGPPPPGSAGYRLPYRNGVMRGVNLAGVVPGRDATLPPLLLLAHYDSVLSAPCADDNAAAVAICLEVATTVAQGASPQLSRDLVVVLCDAEEPPYTGTDSMGSIAFYREQMDHRGAHVVVVQDLTGHQVGLPVGGRELRLPLLRSLVFAMGLESHPALPAVLADLRWGRALRLVAAPNRHVGDVSDHLMFRRQGLPYLFFSCGRWPHYHQPTDTPDRLDYRKMARLARYLTELAGRLDATALPTAGPVGAAGPPSYEESSIDLELKWMRRAFGPYLPLLLRRAGVAALRCRGDLDRIAKLLVGGGL